ncbi:hypothetical protein Q7506_04085 [Glaesserella parasuis]|uniref:transposase n=1 Tax=Glaesserella parasuis TaxID=738 RepID=UPI0003AC0C40|nr:transposase [Glaesserella parasuis]ATW43246.1 hypothetical protein A2U20_05255 [Glaesserella parasuis D74]EQA10686.1 transposase [Glaesserella parasuis D74]MDG6448255.1 hypothetical protein [Glaesserella parasuis]MDG6475957.1 hypothetical protein [Glaesserella parasuis]MDO9767093.1 hypothetical protein [Glaesserella parasuis]
MQKSLRKTNRVTWDTYQNGCYFITICTKNKFHYFGEIHHQKMYLSELGYKLDEIIKDTPKIRNDQYIDIPIYTIMPNHLHFIITINYKINCHQHYFGAQRKNLSSIIRGIKSALTYYARCQNIPFDWQPRFYEHIIQSDRAFNFIYNYIENNIINWEQDRFY